MQAFDYFERSIEMYNNKDYNFRECPKDIMDQMKAHMKEFYELSQLRHLITNSASKCKIKHKQNKNYEINEEEIENMKAA